MPDHWCLTRASAEPPRPHSSFCSMHHGPQVALLTVITLQGDTGLHPALASMCGNATHAATTRRACLGTPAQKGLNVLNHWEIFKNCTSQRAGGSPVGSCRHQPMLHSCQHPPRCQQEQCLPMNNAGSKEAKPGSKHPSAFCNQRGRKHLPRETLCPTHRDRDTAGLGSCPWQPCTAQQWAQSEGQGTCQGLDLHTSNPTKMHVVQGDVPNETPKQSKAPLRK